MLKRKSKNQSKSQDSSTLSKGSNTHIPPLGNIEGLRSKFKVFLSPKFIQQTTLHFNKENAFSTPQHIQTTPNSPKLIHLKRPENTTTPVMIKVKKKKPLDETTIMRKRLSTPFKLEKIEFSDEKMSPIRGENASVQFYQKYRMLDKIQEVNQLYGVRNDASTNFLAKSQSLKLLPSKIGFINERTDPDILKANHFRIGDNYAEVMAEGLKTINTFKRYELAKNRLTGRGAETIIPKINPQNVKHLDLHGNQIGRLGCETLAGLIQRYDCRIIELNLQGNKLGDHAIDILLDSLEFNRTLRSLNINNNLLTDITAVKLGTVLEVNFSITEIYCQWNQFKSKGGLAILKALKENKLIRVVDLSWNSLGLQNSTFARAFSEFISLNTSLIHLDLSNNYFSKADCAIIAEGLKENHTLYGFHFHGNIGYVDAKGFLVVPEDHYSSVSSLHTIHNIEGVKMQTESIKRHSGNLWELKDICWICEGWSQITIGWNPGESGEPDDDPIFIHFSYEDNAGRFISKESNFKMKRMVPPLRFNYFFSIEGNQLAAADQPREEPRVPMLNIDIQGKRERVHVPLVNYMPQKKMNPIINADYNILIDIQPRTPDELYTPPEDKRIRPHWTFQMGVFRDYRIDTKELLEKALEFDLQNSKISKIVKNSEDFNEIKSLLKGIYKNLKDCYRYYSALGTVSDVWSIPMNAFTDFCKNSMILDYKLLKMADLDRLFITTYTKTDKVKNYRSPDHAIVRHQFSEILVRIAQEKYLSDKKTASSDKEAFSNLLSENLIPYIKDFDTDKWRSDRYFLEDVDTVFKSYAPIIRGVYKKYSSAKIPGQRPYMSLDEFKRLISEANMYNEGSGERDTVITLVYSLMTQVDELTNDRIFQIQYLEFLEAFARMTDLYSAPPYGEAETQIPYAKRKEQSLAIKIEGLIPALVKFCVENVIREVWILPQTSIFQMEETFGKQKVISKKRQIVRLDPTHPTSHTYYD